MLSCCVLMCLLIYPLLSSLPQWGHGTLVFSFMVTWVVDDAVLLLSSLANSLALYLRCCSCLVGLRIASLTDITFSVVLYSFLNGFVYLSVTWSLLVLRHFWRALSRYLVLLNGAGTKFELLVAWWLFSLSLVLMWDLGLYYTVRLWIDWY